jgi:hypothetical protein
VGDAPLLTELTLEEKASLCLGSGFWHTAPVPRLGLPAITMADGPHGVRRKSEAGHYARISGSLPATCFPAASALASSFDPGLVRRIGEALGAEARAGHAGRARPRPEARADVCRAAPALGASRVAATARAGTLVASSLAVRRLNGSTSLPAILSHHVPRTGGRGPFVEDDFLRHRF